MDPFAWRSTAALEGSNELAAQRSMGVTEVQVLDSIEGVSLVMCVSVRTETELGSD